MTEITKLVKHIMHFKLFLIIQATKNIFLVFFFKSALFMRISPQKRKLERNPFLVRFFSIPYSNDYYRYVSLAVCVGFSRK